MFFGLKSGSVEMLSGFLLAALPDYQKENRTIVCDRFEKSESILSDHVFHCVKRFLF
jgi:hypothetical protein